MTMDQVKRVYVEAGKKAEENAALKKCDKKKADERREHELAEFLGGQGELTTGKMQGKLHAKTMEKLAAAMLVEARCWSFPLGMISARV